MLNVKRKMLKVYWAMKSGDEEITVSQIHGQS